MKGLPIIAGLCALLLVAGCASSPASQADFGEQAITAELRAFFGVDMTEELEAAVRGVVLEHGLPTGFIVGEESSGAFAHGARFGRGTLHLSNGTTQPVSWTGSSMGSVLGVHNAKMLVLVYDELGSGVVFGPGVNNDLHFVGRVGANFIGYTHMQEPLADSPWETATAGRSL